MAVLSQGRNMKSILVNALFFVPLMLNGHIWHWARNQIFRVHNRYQATLKISNQRYCTKRNIEIMFLLFSWDKDIERKSWVRSGCQISGRCIFICFVLCICYLANYLALTNIFSFIYRLWSSSSTILERLMKSIKIPRNRLPKIKHVT